MNMHSLTEEAPRSCPQVLLIRIASSLIRDLADILRAELPTGVIIDLARVQDMQNINSGHLSESQAGYKATVAAAWALARSFLKARYSPILILGAFQIDSFVQLAVDTDCQLLSASLYMQDSKFVAAHRQIRRRATHRRLDPADFLDGVRVKRALRRLELTGARQENMHIAASREGSDLQMDISSCGASEIAHELLVLLAIPKAIVAPPVSRI